MRDKPYAKLRGQILEIYSTQEAFAKAIGIHPTTLNLKLCKRRTWTSQDIQRVCGALGIPLHEVGLYFFSE